MTIHEGLSWLKVLKERRQELVNLRVENSTSDDRLFGDKKIIHKEPVYSIKAIDKKINALAKEIRILDNAIKSQNAKTEIHNYTPNEDVLEEIE